MLVDKKNELMSDLLFTVHQHGGDDVNVKTTYYTRRFATTTFSATALQHCCDTVSNSYNIVPTLQHRVALKIVVANRPV